MQTVEIIFKRDGTTKIEALGFHGKSCTEATRHLEEVLGQVVKEEKKAEFYEDQDQHQSITGA